MTNELRHNYLEEIEALKTENEGFLTKDQGTANEGHPLTVNAEGKVTTEIPSFVLIKNAEGKVYKVWIDEEGSLVSEPVAESEDDNTGEG